MREYEITIVIQPQLEEEARTQLIERIANLIAPNADEAAKPVQNHWGQRKLAYPIRNYREGYYILFDARVDPDHVSEIERNLQFMDDVLRYLVVRKSD